MSLSWFKYQWYKCLIFIFIFSLIFSQDQTVGLFINDSASSVGYTLFTPLFSTSTYLIDNNGLLVHEWESDYHPAMTAYLLENGNLIRTASFVEQRIHLGGFEEFAWDGTVIWKYEYFGQHHDIEPLPNGNVLMLTTEIKTYSEAIESGRNPEFLDDELYVLKVVEVEKTDSLGGNIVWEWSVWDHLIQDYDPAKLNYGIVADHPELVDINYVTYSMTYTDWIHSNSIDYHPELDQILVSSRAFDEIWIIDHSTTIQEAAGHEGGNAGLGGDLLYRWGNPYSYGAGASDQQMFYGQHDARWIDTGLAESGSITVFNNGLGRPEGGYSSVEELTLPVDSLYNYFLISDSVYGPVEPSWIYVADAPFDFFSPMYSSAQRLSNGNTLICSSTGGEFFEVTEDGTIVWRYINPVSFNEPLFQGDSVLGNTVPRCYRYGVDYGGFNGHDLTPGGPIELYLNISDKLETKLPRYFRLYRCYPNPFNPSTTIKYDLPIRSHVTVFIYDILGKEVKRLVNIAQEPGNKSVSWNGTDSFGNPVSAGVYLYQIRAGEFLQTKKMVLLK